MSKRLFLLSFLLFSITDSFSDDALTGISQAENLSASFERVAELVTPGVVSIKAVQKVKPKQFRRGELPSDPFGEDFFRRFFEEAPGNPGFKQQGLGTGFVYDADGHVIANHHVVEGADDIRIVMSDDQEFKAEVVGSDKRSDLAVLKIKATNLKPVQMGDSDNLRIGQWVVAVGNPFGLQNTITAGIVSAKGRAISGGTQYEDFIQTDAAINPGNSGGPLVNLKGEVIGINTAIFSRSGGNMGIGFAIPSSMAKKIISSLISGGKVVRGWLGVMIQNLSDDLAKSFSYNSKTGALIGDVEEGSPADKAGIKSGEIVTKLDGKSVKDVNSLRNEIGSISPGTTVILTLFSEGKERDVKVTLSELSEEQANSDNYESQAGELGMSVTDITPEIASNNNIKTSGKVLVVNLDPYGLAAEAGIQRGDIILKVGKQEVQSAKHFEKIISQSDLSQGVLLVIETKGSSRFISIKKSE